MDKKWKSRYFKKVKHYNETTRTLKIDIYIPGNLVPLFIRVNPNYRGDVEKFVIGYNL